MTRLQDVNTTKIRDAIGLDCQTMSSTFGAGYHGIPFFLTWAYPDARFAWEPWCTEAHVSGCHLNALLSAEDALCIPISKDAVETPARRSTHLAAPSLCRSTATV
jgi:hypothetical protein